MVGSSKHNEGLQYAQTELVANMTTSNEIKTRRGATKLVLCNELEILGGDLIFNLFVV